MAFKPLALTATSGAQLRLAYDSSNYTNLTTGSGGDLTIAPTGGDTAITGTLSVSSTIAVTGASTLTGNVLVGGASGGTVELAIRGVAGSGIPSLKFEAEDGSDRFALAATTLSGTTTNDVLALSTLGTERLRVTGGGIVAVGTTVTTSASAGEVVLANAKAVRGVNAAGSGTATLIKYNSSDYVSLGNSGSRWEVIFFDATTSTTVTKEVSLGAADSGGAGFRVLRVTN